MKKIDKLVKRVEYFERVAVYGDRNTFLKAISQDFTPPYVDSNVPTDGGQSVNPIQTAKETVISVPARINPKVQGMLNSLLVPNGDILPLKEDGEMGDLTKAALRKFKSRYNKPASINAITEEFNALNSKNQLAQS